MEYEIDEEEAKSAQDAFEILCSWQWGYFDPDNHFHASGMAIDDLINRLAFFGHPKPKSAILTLFLQGRIQAFGSYQWASFNGADEFRRAEHHAAILVVQWAKLRAGIEFKAKFVAPDEKPWTEVDLPRLGYEDQPVAEWKPEFNRFSYALRPQGKDEGSEGYFEEHFAAFDLTILPLAMEGPDGEIIGPASQFFREFDEPDEQKKIEKRGRRPKYDWPAATLAVFGQIHRGDLKPGSQADIERALIDYMSGDDSGPSESTVRPYAKLIWLEAQKE